MELDLREYIEKTCKKLRNTARYFGEEEIRNAIIIGTVDLEEYNLLPEAECHNMGGKPYVYAPTITDTTLGNVQGGIARFFEEDAETFYDSNNNAGDEQ